MGFCLLSSDDQISHHKGIKTVITFSFLGWRDVCQASYSAPGGGHRSFGKDPGELLVNKNVFVFKEVIYIELLDLQELS